MFTFNETLLANYTDKSNVLVKSLLVSVLLYINRSRHKRSQKALVWLQTAAIYEASGVRCVRSLSAGWGQSELSGCRTGPDQMYR